MRRHSERAASPIAARFRVPPAVTGTWLGAATLYTRYFRGPPTRYRLATKGKSDTPIGPLRARSSPKLHRFRFPPIPAEPVAERPKALYRELGRYRYEKLTRHKRSQPAVRRNRRPVVHLSQSYHLRRRDGVRHALLCPKTESGRDAGGAGRG